MRRRAFTLVELLVTLGIIALLISILLPSLSQARSNAKKVACLAGLADVGRSFQMYRNAYDDRYPPAAIHPINNDGLAEDDPSRLPPLKTFLEVYSDEGMDVLACPADTLLAPDFGESYFYNAELGMARLYDTITFRIFDDPTRTPVLRDGHTFHGGDTPFATLFADGHAEGNFWPSPDEVEDIREVDPGNFFTGFTE